MRFFVHFALALFVLSAPLSVAAIEYGGFGGRPAFPRPDNLRTESVFVHTAEPGTLIDEGVRVINNMEETQTFRVYSGDNIPSSGGGYACSQFLDANTDVGTWIELEETEVTLEPATNVVVPFTISVPVDAGVGEHNGCILIDKKPEDSEDEAGISLTFRTGLRLSVLVPGEIERNLEIVSFNTTVREDGNVLLSPVVANTGNASINANVLLVTKSVFGKTLAEHGGEFTVLRGDEFEFNFELKRPFWGGFYKSSMTAWYDASDETEQSEDSEQIVELELEPVWFFMFPQTPALLVELLVVVFFVILFLSFVLVRKQRAWVSKKWEARKTRSGENLRKLAEKHGVSWKLIAKVNHIKPPYTIATGTELKLPPKPPAKKKKKTT